MSIKLYNTILHQKQPGFGWLFKLGLFARDLAYQTYGAWASIFSKNSTSPTIHSQDIQKILVIRPDRIGDFVLFTPTLNLLNDFFPQAKIDLFTQKGTSSIAPCFSGWNQLHTFQDIDNAQERNAFIQEARGQYQVVLVYSSMRVVYKLAAKLKANMTLGWNVKGMGYTLSHSLNHKLWIKDNMHMVHINAALVSLLAQCVQDWDQTKKESAQAKSSRFSLSYPFRETEDGQRQCKDFLEKKEVDKTKPILIIHPSSFTYRVRWEAHKFAEIANRAHRHNASVIFIGTPHDNDTLQLVYKCLNFTPISAVGELNLQGTASLLKNASVFLGNSTGPMHLAASTGTPTIAIFGNRYPMDREEMWHPWGLNGHVISVDKQVCCQMPWTCQEMKCIKNVSVEMVWSKVQEFIQ